MIPRNKRRLLGFAFALPVLILAMLAFSQNPQAVLAQTPGDCDVDSTDDPPDGCLIIVVQTDPEDADEEFDFELTIDDEEAEEFNLADQAQFAFALQDEGEYVIEHLELDDWEIDSIDCEGSLDIEEDDTGFSFEIDGEPEGQSLRCIFALTSTADATDDDDESLTTGARLSTQQNGGNEEDDSLETDATEDDDEDSDGGGTIESLPSTAGSQSSQGAAPSQPLPSTAATQTPRASSQPQPGTSAAEASRASSSPIRAPSTGDAGLR
jgi:hypothetical protein